MNRIQLYNRDGANLWLEKIENSTWKLKVDEKHSYCLNFIRIIFSNEDDIEAVDPSGGPFISVNDTFDNYRIDKILNETTFLISENNND